MKLNSLVIYQNESILINCMQNLTKNEITSMEQILSFSAQCMLKLFQTTGENNLIEGKEW